MPNTRKHVSHNHHNFSKEKTENPWGSLLPLSFWVTLVSAQVSCLALWPLSAHIHRSKISSTTHCQGRTLDFVTSHLQNLNHRHRSLCPDILSIQLTYCFLSFNKSSTLTLVQDHYSIPDPRTYFPSYPTKIPGPSSIVSSFRTWVTLNSRVLPRSSILFNPMALIPQCPDTLACPKITELIPTWRPSHLLIPWSGRPFSHYLQMAIPRNILGSSQRGLCMRTLLAGSLSNFHCP